MNFFLDFFYPEKRRREKEARERQQQSDAAHSYAEAAAAASTYLLNNNLYVHGGHGGIDYFSDSNVYNSRRQNHYPQGSNPIMSDSGIRQKRQNSFQTHTNYEPNSSDASEGLSHSRVRRNATRPSAADVLTGYGSGGATDAYPGVKPRIRRSWRSGAGASGVVPVGKDNPAFYPRRILPQRTPSVSDNEAVQVQQQFYNRLRNLQNRRRPIPSTSDLSDNETFQNRNRYHQVSNQRRQVPYNMSDMSDNDTALQLYNRQNGQRQHKVTSISDTEVLHHHKARTSVTNRSGQYRNMGGSVRSVRSRPSQDSLGFPGMFGRTRSRTLVFPFRRERGSFLGTFRLKYDPRLLKEQEEKARREQFLYMLYLFDSKYTDEISNLFCLIE